MKVEKKFQKGDIVMLPVMIDGEAEPGSPYDYNVSYEDTIVGGRNPLFVRSADIMEASNIDWERKYHEGLDKQQKELQARYDELDSVNKEQAEKIRRQDKALTDLKQRNDKLQDENTNLTFLLEDQPKEEPTRTVHAVLNDGTGYNFFKCTKASFDNYADFSVLKIYRGEEYVAGFLRGDKPGNLAYWWTE